MYVSLGIFTQYRRELMGVATVLILLCHSLLPPAIHCPNDILRWIIITGNRGVDIFLFLSGLGMYHSLRKMTKWNRGGVIRWYAKRYRHILLPYLLICFPYYLVLGCVNDGHFSISIFLYRLSTLNYWLEHKGFWYIAMLIPLYFLTPFYARIIDKTKYQTLLTVTLCIIAEQYIEDKKSHELYDYKFFCFNGKVKLFKIDFDRFTEHHANYYTPTGEILPLVETAYPPQFDRIISMPSTLPQMISLAETLSCGIPFLRVDFYTIGMDIFFGELTFFPTSGMTPFEPKDWDKKLGDMLILPTKNK